MAKRKKWVVTTQGRSFAEVRKDLGDAGFSVDHGLEDIGVFTGDADDETAEKIRGLKGVTDVSPDAPIDIGPPGSSKTW